MARRTAEPPSPQPMGHVTAATQPPTHSQPSHGAVHSRDPSPQPIRHVTAAALPPAATQPPTHSQSSRRRDAQPSGRPSYTATAGAKLGTQSRLRRDPGHTGSVDLAAHDRAPAQTACHQPQPLPKARSCPDRPARCSRRPRRAQPSCCPHRACHQPQRPGMSIGAVSPAAAEPACRSATSPSNEADLASTAQPGPRRGHRTPFASTFALATRSASRPHRSRRWVAVSSWCRPGPSGARGAARMRSSRWPW